MNYTITESDVKNIKYAISAIETETGNTFAEDECNGKRCFKHCKERDFCLLRAKLMLGKIVSKANSTKGLHLRGEDQSAEMFERIERLVTKINAIEAIQDAPLDGSFEHQRANCDKMLAKLNFYEFVKRILRGDAGKERKMASDNETVADIVREMRNDKGVDNAGWFEGKHMRWFADRIEAANKREVAELKQEISEWKSNCDFNHDDRKKKLSQIEDLRRRLKVAEDALDVIRGEGGAE